MNILVNAGADINAISDNNAPLDLLFNFICEFDGKNSLRNETVAFLIEKGACPIRAMERCDNYERECILKLCEKDEEFDILINGGGGCATKSAKK